MRGLACYLKQAANARADSEVAKHAPCFEALCRIVEKIQQASKCSIDTDSLQQLVSLYLQSFKALYTEEPMIIKFHYLHHHAPQIHRWCDKAFPNCFTLERKHKSVKRFADNNANCGDDSSLEWDRGLLRDITCRHLSNLENDVGQFKVEQGLQKPRKITAKLQGELTSMFGAVHAEYQTGHVSRCNEWERVSKGDLVIAEVDGRHLAGKVAYHISMTLLGSTTYLSLLEPFVFESDLNGRCSVHKRCTEGKWVFTRDIVTATIWAPTGDSCRILRPVHVEPKWV